MRSGRGAVLLVAALVAVGALAGTRLTAAPFPPVPHRSGGGAVLADATSQAWYCGLGTGGHGGQADASVVLANTSNRVLRGVVTVFANSSGAANPAGPSAQSITLGPYSRGSLRLGDAAPSSASFVAAEVVFAGPGGAAEVQVSGSLGTAAVPCAGAPSPEWDFAAGTTRQGASLVLGLFNPFPEDAIVDLSFADESGYSQPAAFEGIFVPGRSLVAVDIGAHVVEQAQVATTVTARVGRIVAAELQLDTIRGETGLSVVTGGTTTTRWYLPDGVVQPGLSEQLHVYDPGPAPAQVTVTPHLSQGRAAPFQLSLAPRSEQVLDLSGQPRLPQGDDFSLVVDSAGAPVVVGRTVQSVSPAPRRGSAQMLGASVAARRWLVAAGGVNSTQDEFVTVLDPGTRPAHVTLSYFAAGTSQPVPGLGSITVAPGANSNVRVGEYLSLADLSVVVSSDVPVVVERDLFQVGGNGISLAIAVPAT